MAGEQNNEGGDRGLNGQQPTTADLISQFKGAAAEDGEVKSVQDGIAKIADPDAAVDDEPDDDATAAGKRAAAAVGNRAPVVPGTVPKPKSAQERIDTAVRKQRQAERELASERTNSTAILARLAALEAGRAPPPAGAVLPNAANGAKPAKDASSPDPTKYQYGDLDPRYIADLARHEARSLIEGDKKARDDAAQVEANAAAQAAFVASVTKVVADGVAQYPDFQETVMDSADRGEWDLTRTIGDLSFDSVCGPAILYHLATNVDESKAVAKMAPAKQAAWFGKMEAAFEPEVSARTTAAAAAGNAGGAKPAAGSSAVRASSAPTPPAIRVRGQGNPNPVSADTTDFAAFERLAASAGSKGH